MSRLCVAWNWTFRQVKLRVVSEAVLIRQVVLYYLKEPGGLNHKQKRAETAALWDTKTQTKAIRCSPLKQNTLAASRQIRREPL